MWKRVLLYIQNIPAINRTPLCEFSVLIQTNPTENFQENQWTWGTGRATQGKHQGGTQWWSDQRCHNHWQNFQASKERTFKRSRDWGREREGMGRWTEKGPDELNSDLKLSTWGAELPDKPCAWWSCTFLTPASHSGTGTNLQPFWCQLSPNKYNSLCNLKRKQRSWRIPACHRLTHHLSQALPNLLLSQFLFKPFSRLKD